jgi:hypothetical protein
MITSYKIVFTKHAAVTCEAATLTNNDHQQSPLVELSVHEELVNECTDAAGVSMTSPDISSAAPNVFSTGLSFDTVKCTLHGRAGILSAAQNNDCRGMLHTKILKEVIGFVCQLSRSLNQRSS